MCVCVALLGLSRNLLGRLLASSPTGQAVAVAAYQDRLAILPVCTGPDPARILDPDPITFVYTDHHLDPSSSSQQGGSSGSSSSSRLGEADGGGCSARLDEAEGGGCSGNGTTTIWDIVFMGEPKGSVHTPGHLHLASLVVRWERGGGGQRGGGG